MSNIILMLVMQSNPTDYVNVHSENCIARRAGEGNMIAPTENANAQTVGEKNDVIWSLNQQWQWHGIVDIDCEDFILASIDRAEYWLSIDAK